MSDNQIRADGKGRSEAPGTPVSPAADARSSLWDRIHRRQEEMNVILHTTSRDLSDKELQLVLEMRAIELARPSESQRLTGEHTMLVFSLGKELYAADLLYTKAVIRPAVYTPLSGVPPFIAGIVNCRGMILTVLDLRPFFGLQRDEQQEDGAILMTEAGGVTVGLLTETIEAITDLPLGKPSMSLLTFTGIRQEYTTAVVPYGNRLVAVLNMEALLQDPRLVVEAEI